MSKSKTLISGIVILLIVVLASACAGPVGEQGQLGPAGPPGPQGPVGPPGDDASVRLDYVGTEKCGQCHEAIYQKFMLSGHPYKLTKIEEGQPPVFPYDNVTGGVQSPPEGVTWNDISYVIGGYAWKARFIDQNGYIITGDANATTQYNYANPELELDPGWVPYHAGEAKPYDCGTCHTTGYRTEGHQDDLEGIIGTWEFPGIQCEACHGPGNLHASDPYGFLMKIDRDSQACGECHRRGDVTQVDASGGFIKHHEQFEEVFTSKHMAIDCVVCHDPHASAVYTDEELNPNAGLNRACIDCHFEKTYAKTGRHFFLDCVDCHMPAMAKSATGDIERFTGDISSHLFAINPDPDAPQFTEDGSFSMPYITLDYACKHCHGVLAIEKDIDVMAALAQGYHDRPVESTSP